MPKVALTTVGCKLNYAETSAVAHQFRDRGFEIVEFGEPADVCVINTCSVTQRADRECRQLIRRAVRTSDTPFIVVTGCYAQLAPQEVAAIRGVDLVLGSNEKFELFDHLDGLEKKLYPHVFVSPVDNLQEFDPAYTTSTADRTRAFLKIQDGCDYSCTFCTIPLARGASRSQDLDACVTQARDLVARGYKEIVLTGVNVGDYSRTSGGNLLTLLRALERVKGLRRLRISSIEPNLITEDIISHVAESEITCKHFHIPLQSGSDTILRRMRRRYTTAQYADRVDRIRTSIPECGIGVDVIAGFPGETDALFEETRRFLTDLPFSYLHVFTYSERPNTPAADLEGQVEPKVRFKRNEILRQFGKKVKHTFHARMVGKTEPVLVEGKRKGASCFGFTSNYVKVALPVDSVEENTIVPVRITSAGYDACPGQPVCEGVTA
jgi:threonylcarbamoyladenosine tRNA methylthiotransferase MtaB